MVDTHSRRSIGNSRARTTNSKKHPTIKRLQRWLPLLIILATILTFPQPLTAAVVVDPDGVGATDISPADPTAWTSSKQAYVGREASGALLVNGGSEVVSSFGFIGYRSDSTGTVTIDDTGSDWTNSNNLYIGYWGSGTLEIMGGGTVSNSISDIGFYAGSTGIVTVDGTDSTWTNSGSLYVGHEGSGTMTVTNGGQVTCGTLYASSSCLFGNGTISASMGAVLDTNLDFNAAGGSQTSVAFGSGGSLNVYVAGGNLGVGYKETGTMSIAEGVTIESNDGYLGYYSGSIGQATVTGTSSTWTNSGSLYVGREGSGTLTVTNGGQVTAETLYASQSNLFGTGTISSSKGAVLDTDLCFNASGGSQTSVAFGSGGTLTVNVAGGNLGVGYKETGTMSIAEGVTIESDDGYLGYYSGSTGAVTINGTDSVWTNASDLYVGRSGNGIMEITGGGAVSSQYGHIGRYSGSTGVVTVNGTGSAWTNSTNLFVGCSGNGTLGITGGGAVNSQYGYIGAYSGSTGTATVNGIDSTWTNSSDLYIGNNGDGTLNITGGGAVSNQYGYIGNNSNSTGIVTVNGTGSTWTNASSLRVGDEGNGTLEITGGGVVSNYYGYVGYDSDSTSVVKVNGTGSTWTNASKLYVGYMGNGTLEITGGGAVSSSYGSVGTLLGSVGTVTVDGTGSTWLNSGDLEVGHTGSGTLEISNGGLVTVAGSTKVGIYTAGQGTINFDGGTLETGTLFADDAKLTGMGTILLHGVIVDDALVLDSPDDLTGYYRTIDALPGQDITVNLDIDGQGCLGAGYSGIGSLTIANGLAVASTIGYIGYRSGSTGTVTVHGTDSTWMINDDLYVGHNGNGTLEITNGGLTTVAGSTHVGRYSGNPGTINFNNGTLDTASLDADDEDLTGTGTIIVHSVIIDYALVLDTHEDLTGFYRTINDEPDQNITVNYNIDGKGRIDVGGYDIGSLTIINGLTVASTGGSVGPYNGSGYVSIDGPGSAWVSNSLIVGFYGSGKLEITNGGLLEVEEIGIDILQDNNSSINIAAGGMLALMGDADGSLAEFLDLVGGTDAIRYWDETASGWADILGATNGDDYTLEYINDVGSDLYGYTILTVLTTTAPGDANWDGMVNELDAAVLAGNWGKAGGWSDGDFNHDGRVNAADASILAANWGHGTEGLTNVPEPSMLVMLLALTLLICRRRFR